MAPTLRVLTYNVHSCIGSDQRLGPERVLRVIRRFAPDVVALQELDIGQDRTQGLHQAEFFARGLSMQLHFAPARERLGGHYGNAILTRQPSQLVRSENLPRLHDACEPRAAIWVAVETDFGELHVLNVHLGLQRRERGLQAEALLGKHWLTDPRRGELAIVCGDFNATPGSAVYTRFAERLTDAQLAAGGARPTFPAIWPLVRIDHVFVTPRLRVIGADVPAGLVARVASDHRPLVADVTLADA
jgi:endonuclease/exonuclease/phosphatase family metal-dependent hydrolase